MTLGDPPLPSPVFADAKQKLVLEAAVSVFARFGYRKASMDEVAQAAGISRQGLYLQFSNKEELFRRALEHSLHAQLGMARDALGDAQVPLQQRLVAACDAWAGRFIGISGAAAADLMCASTSLGGGLLTQYEAQFEAAIAACVDRSALLRPLAAAGITPDAAAHAIHATARGLKQRSKTRAEFVAGVETAIKMFCICVSNQRIEG